jgi:hypothetical protein
MLDTIILFFNDLSIAGKITILAGMLLVLFSIFKKLIKLLITTIFVVALIMWLLG